MRLGSQVIDTSRPDLIAVFNGTHLRGGIQYASLKYPGRPMLHVPSERVQPMNRLGRPPVAGPPKPRGTPGRKPLLKPEEYSWLRVVCGIEPEELHRRAAMTGSTVREALEAFQECHCGHE